MTSTRLRAEINNSPPGAFFHAAKLDRFGSTSAVETALFRLEKSGVLRRVAKGVYWKALRSRFGTGKPALFDVALEVAKDKAPGPTGATAAYVLGLSTQMSPAPELAVVGAKPTSISGVKFRSRGNAMRARLEPLEIAVLEVARDDMAHAEISKSEAINKLRSLAASRTIDVNKIAEVAEGESSRVRRFVAALTS